MRIVINTIDEKRDSGENYRLLYESFQRIIKVNPEHFFIFLTDNQREVLSEPAQNTRTIVIKHKSKNLLRKKWWFDTNLTSLLKKNKADLFVSADIFCSLRSHVPQIIIPGIFSFHAEPPYLKKTQKFFYRRFLRAFIRKTKSIIVFSEFEKKELIRTYQANPEKINVVYGNANTLFRPVDFEIRERIKNDYADGKEFFLSSGMIGSEKNLVNLLKAFSLFKKRQQSNIKLLIAGKLSSGHDIFFKSLETYKYRNDVVIIKNPDEAVLAGITASAFALVYPALPDMTYLPIIEAMQCGLPVITSTASQMAEIAGAASLLADAANPKEIAEQLMRIYKDEKLWNDMIEKSKERSFYFSAERTDELLWQCIQKSY